jgi:hypothetical protein
MKVKEHVTRNILQQTKYIIAYLCLYSNLSIHEYTLAHVTVNTHMHNINMCTELRV